MAHTPDLPERFVCLNCHVIHAGSVIHQDDGTHRFEAPDACGACEHSDFVELGGYIHHHD